MGSSNSKEKEEEEDKGPGLWGSVKQGYAEIVNAIIRPPRAQYRISDLGPTEFTYAGRGFERKDFTLTNSRGLKLQVSHWMPADTHRPATKLPAVIYLHGNSSSRMGCMDNLEVVLTLGVTMVAIDFAGSGQSEGEWVTLGEYEKDDVACVVDHLRSAGQTSTIGLWGRSMGAATALLHSHRDPSIAAIVLDSPFADLRQLANEMVEMGKEQSGYKVPGLLVKAAIKMVQQSVWKKAKLDINALSPIENVDKAFIPALFCHGSGDDFIKVHHSRQIYEKYAGDKNLVVVDGDHNSPRPAFFQHSAGIFLRTALQVPDEIVIPGDPEMREPLMSCFTRARRRSRKGSASGPSSALARQREMEAEMMRQVMAMSLLTASGGRTREPKGGSGSGGGAGGPPKGGGSGAGGGAGAEPPFEPAPESLLEGGRGRGSSASDGAFGAESMAEDPALWFGGEAMNVKAVAPTADWNCGACTFLNPAAAVRCSICSEPYIEEGGTGGGGGGGGGVGDPEAATEPAPAPAPAPAPTTDAVAPTTAASASASASTSSTVGDDKKDDAAKPPSEDPVDERPSTAATTDPAALDTAPDPEPAPVAEGKLIDTD